MTLIWVASVRTKDASIIDRFWGLIFVLLSLTFISVGDAEGWRVGVVFSLVLVWGGRLSLHIHLRNRGHGEDIRYQRIRARHGDSFWWYSLINVFLLQGLLAHIVAAPLFLIFVTPSSLPLVWTDFLGILLWGVGFAFEAGGDWQLKKFKANPDNAGKLCTTGFWSLTRHPNYFGDACIWWGYYAFALSVPGGWITFFGPALMTYLLAKVTGVSLLEEDLKKTKPGYRDYIESTPAFFPRIGKRRRSS